MNLSIIEKLTSNAKHTGGLFFDLGPEIRTTGDGCAYADLLKKLDSGMMLFAYIIVEKSNKTYVKSTERIMREDLHTNSAGDVYYKSVVHHWVLLDRVYLTDTASKQRTYDLELRGFTEAID